MTARLLFIRIQTVTFYGHGYGHIHTLTHVRIYAREGVILEIYRKLIRRWKAKIALEYRNRNGEHGMEKNSENRRTCLV